MRTGYQRNLKSTYLILEEDVLYQEDYQMRMLQENHVEGLLNLRGRGADEKSLYHYDISRKVSMNVMYEKTKIRHEELEEFLRQLIQTMSAVRSYLLDVNCILLDPEYIFCEKGQFYFCYFPLAKGALCEAFHKLSEYFVSQANYEDQEGIFMAYELHKITMEENYSLEQVQSRMTEVVRECKKEEEEQRNELWEEEDWMGEIEMGAHVMKEQKSGWKGVKGFWNHRKKTKWGEWEELSLEEEEQ